LVVKLVLASVLASFCIALSACSGADSSQGSQGSQDNQQGSQGVPAQAASGAADSAAAANSAAPDPSKVTREIVIGTMITEDILPLWAAESDGLFAAYGIKARVESFQSAQELATAVASGAVDLAMTDPMVTAALVQGGTDVTMHWVTLGATAAQGRFGIMANPDSGVTSLKELAGKPIGVGSNTILEYVMDKLMAKAGVPSDQVKVEEIKKIPVRYEMMSSNQVAAAALPGSLLALGEATGMVLVADDSKGENLSQSVMIARNAFTATAEGATALAIVRAVWDEAATTINADPGKYRALLIEKTLAAMPASVQESYPLSSYPLAELPTSAMIDPVLEWMLDKGYLDWPLVYDPTTGSLAK
jgi:NitT/TauT family transport system substrate-binding protein